MIAYSRYRTPVLFGLLLLTAGCRIAFGAGASRSLYSLTEENDGVISSQDHHYTQGVMFTRTVSPVAGGFWEKLDHGFSRVACFLGAERKATSGYSWPIVGQSIFTPSNLEATRALSGKRPYAGWLYLGMGLQRRTNRGRIDRFQLLVGVVGPWAQGQWVQEKFHHVFGYKHADGWDNQLHNEPGLIATYQTSWRLPLLRRNWLEVDLQPEAGIAVGNVLTYGDTGLALRFGQGLRSISAPKTITPGLSGTGWYRPGRIHGVLGWMLMGGVQTRAVWRNLFLQGNTFQDSPGVEKRDFVTDVDVGLSLVFRVGLRVDFVYVRRSREYVTQDSADRFGSITLSMMLG